MFREEHRAMERFDLKMPVFIRISSTDDDEFEMVTRNICAGGAFFETAQPLPVGTMVDVDLMLCIKDFKKKTRIQVSGEVIRVEQEGMVVKFSHKYNMLECGW